MARSPRISREFAVDVFERHVTARWSLDTYSPHLVDRDVHEMWLGADDTLGPLGFLDAWMAWKAKRRGFGYTVLDEHKPEEAAAFARNALLYGLVRTTGAGAGRRLWRTSLAPMYERDSRGFGGRLRLPAPPPGERRVGVDRMHATVAGPIIERMLMDLASRPGTLAIPGTWISAGLVPEHLRGQALTPNAGILAGLCQDMGTHQHIRWMAMLRGELLAQDGLPVRDADVDALGALL